MERKINQRKLRNLIVNKKQLMIVIIGTVYLFLSITLIFMVIVAPLYLDIFQSTDTIYQRDSAKVFIALSDKLVLALFAAFLFVFLPLVSATHRIFGPLINFSNVFKKISGGDLNARVHLRRGDLLKAEAALANEMIESLANSVDEIKKQNDSLIRTINEVIHGNERNGSSSSCELDKIHDQALLCRKLLSSFKTADPNQSS